MKIDRVAAYVLAYVAPAQNASVEEWKQRVAGLNVALQKEDTVALMYGPGEVDCITEGGQKYYKVNDLGICRAQRCEWWNEIRKAHMTLGKGDTNDALYISLEGIRQIWPHVRDKQVRTKLRDVAEQAEPLSEVVMAALSSVGHVDMDMRLAVTAHWLRRVDLGV